jgi:hypothetical protein
MIKKNTNEVDKEYLKIDILFWVLNNKYIYNIYTYIN